MGRVGSELRVERNIDMMRRVNERGVGRILEGWLGSLRGVGEVMRCRKKAGEVEQRVGKEAKEGETAVLR